MAWPTEPKTKLQPDEVVKVAFMHLIGGIDQHLIATMFAINSARIAEACVAMRWAAENHKKIYDDVKGGAHKDG